MAEALHHRALAIFEQVYGSDHYEIAVDLHGLAFVHQRRDDYGAAEPLLRRALTIKQRVLGPNHPEIGSVLNTLGVVLQRQGRPGEAVACTPSCRERVLAPERAPAPAQEAAWQRSGAPPASDPGAGRRRR